MNLLSNPIPEFSPASYKTDFEYVTLETVIPRTKRERIFFKDKMIALYSRKSETKGTFINTMVFTKMFIAKAPNEVLSQLKVFKELSDREFELQNI